MTINEDRLAYFAVALGHTGQLSDLEWEWLRTQVVEGPYPNIPDMWMAYLRAQGYTGNSISDGMGILAYPLSRNAGGGVPVGYTRSTLSGVQFTYNGAPVFDNSPSTPLSVRTA